MVVHCGGGFEGERLNTPGEGENRRSHSEADDVGEGVDLAAEIAARVGHASDATIESVEDESESDALGGDNEVLGGGGRVGPLSGALHGAQHREEA